MRVAIPTPSSVASESALAAWQLVGLVTRSGLETLRGVGDLPGLDWVSVDSLAALVTPLDGGTVARLRDGRGGEDVEWLAPRVLAHQNHLQQAAERTAVMPARFGVLFDPASGRLEELLRERAAVILAALAHVDGCREWAVEVTVDPTRARASLGGAGESEDDLGDPLAPEEGGRAYLERRKRQRQRQPRERSRWTAVADGAQAALHEVARDQVPLTTAASQPRRLVHRAFLVDEELRGDFLGRADAAAEILAPLGLELAVTGPWPCYSFCPSLGAS